MTRATQGARAGHRFGISSTEFHEGEEQEQIRLLSDTESDGLPEKDGERDRGYER